MVLLVRRGRKPLILPKEQQSSDSPSLPSVTFEEAVTTVNNLVFTQKRRYLSEAEIVVLKGAWNSQDFSEIIAQQTTYAGNYLQRRVAPQLWTLLSEVLGEPVIKRKARFLLEQAVRKYSNSDLSSDINSEGSGSIKGQPPDTSVFYGRKQELLQLKKLISDYRCVPITGVPGIGKSTLSAKLLSDISLESSQKFDFLIWKSITHPVPIQDLVADLIKLIHPIEPSIVLPDQTQAIITVLIKHLHSHRCLVVLDGFEALFRASNLEQRLEYKILIRRLLEEEHQSRFILNCRVFPSDLNTVLKYKQAITCFRLEGLDTESARQFLTDQGLTDQDKLLDIIYTYRGNVAELQAVAQRIKYFFAGSAEKFYQHKTTFITDEFQSMLDETFSEVLTPLERYIMVYLAERISLDVSFLSFNNLLIEINSQYDNSASTSTIIKALENLERFSLVESMKDPNTKEISFTLQPVVKKYITQNSLGLLPANAFPSPANAS
ncbi:NACHT domain-containing protein [Nostoc sp. FACHB-87]|uniref:NACHT domain-containing protein n=1 Tax=Nostocaceae TaxID=1162 RepID=UPI001688423D|nr:MULTISPECIES: NACHT domain-containing protein [Nostocaceae]MBD2303481.1 NACHT domain-containing protein [Nostoc sp. FACHB-190]MBD2457332.1 NACHT domain-containing protein [Nostoc sp. FACHB-87]MBD2478401.1 NACHT domain-containing protein [Anabaena sp. FACHB-83]